MGDITGFLSAGSATAAHAAAAKKSSESYDLDMQDFLTLMVTELQCQSIDATADTSEMLNQMVMMQMVSALTNMTDASVMSYAASLVGKTVTVGQYDSEGVLQEVVGTVTGTGSMGGEQVVFVNDKYYYMNEIMAVGTLPEMQETEQAPSEEGVVETPDVEQIPSEDGSVESPDAEQTPSVEEYDPNEPPQGYGIIR